MKPTLLLATGLFLIGAPAPDADDVAELTVNFIVPKHVAGTLAADDQIERKDDVTDPPASSETIAAARTTAAGQDGF